MEVPCATHEAKKYPLIGGLKDGRWLEHDGEPPSRVPILTEMGQSGSEAGEMVLRVDVYDRKTVSVPDSDGEEMVVYEHVKEPGRYNLASCGYLEGARLVIPAPAS